MSDSPNTIAEKAFRAGFAAGAEHIHSLAARTVMLHLGDLPKPVQDAMIAVLAALEIDDLADPQSTACIVGGGGSEEAGEAWEAWHGMASNPETTATRSRL